MELIAVGRTADVFAIDDGRVLRRYRNGNTVDAEARIMRELQRLGYPVPQTYEADGSDLTMEHITGPTILAELAREPAQVERYGRLLGDLHQRLHRLAAPEWLRRVSGHENQLPASVLHLDLHPDNVVLGPHGPIVIDWTNAAAGPPELDVALTMLLTLAADLTEIGAERFAVQRTEFLQAFVRTCGSDPRRGLQAAIAYRLADPGVTTAEREWITEHGANCLDPFTLGRA